MSNDAPPIDPDLEWFSVLVQELQDMGFDAATANRYAAIIGDTPIVDEATGKLVILDERGIEIALINMPPSFASPSKPSKPRQRTRPRLSAG